MGTGEFRLSSKNTHALEDGADPEEPAPGDVGCDVAGDYWADEEAEEVSPEVEAHPDSSLVEEHYADLPVSMHFVSRFLLFQVAA